MDFEVHGLFEAGDGRCSPFWRCQPQSPLLVSYQAIASQSVAEGPDFQGAINKRFFTFFLFQTMSYAQTSGGGDPGTQKWGRGTWIPLYRILEPTLRLSYPVLIAGGTDWCVPMRRRHEAVQISCVLILG